MVVAARLIAITLLMSLAGGASAQSLTVNVDVFGLNENQFNANTALQGACATIAIDGPADAAAADLLNTCAALGPLGDDDPALAAGLDRLVPEEALSLSDSLTDATDTQVSNVYSRIAVVRRQTTPSATELFALRDRDSSTMRRAVGNALNAVDDAGGAISRKKLEIFIGGQIAGGDVDGANVQQSASIASSSLTLGADYRLTNRFIVGVGTGYRRSDTTFDSVAGGTDVEGFNLTLFGTYYSESAFYVDAVLDVGSSSVDLARQLNLPGSMEVLALGETDSTTYSLSAGVGHTFTFRGWDLSPRARLGFTNSSVDAYRERADSTGPGFGSTLSVGSQAVRSERLSVGASLSRAISTRRGVVVPHLSLDMEFENEEDKDDIDAAFVADPEQRMFLTEGTARDRQYANVGLGATAVFRNGRSAYASYETRLQHDFITQHWLKAGARLEF